MRWTYGRLARVGSQRSECVWELGKGILWIIFGNLEFLEDFRWIENTRVSRDHKSG